MTLHSHRGRNTLNLVADVPKTEVIPNVFDHGLDAGAEFMKPGADISVEQLQSGVLSAAVNIKRPMQGLWEVIKVRARFGRTHEVTL